MLLALALLAAAILAPPASAAAGAERTLSVAAAANLKPAVEALTRGFEAEHPDVRAKVTLGASGSLFAQIRNGAPFDVFFSADAEYPARLVEAGVAARGDERVYALGKLAAWAPRGSPVRLEEEGLRALAGPGVRRLAIANPAVAPYGRAAEAALRSAGIHEAVKGRLVLGQNVSQAAQFAQSGAADAAIVPLSLALSPELAGGKVLALPEGSYPAPEQTALVLGHAREPELARAFLRWVTGPRGREVLARHGYGLP